MYSSGVEMAVFYAKREALDKEESRRTLVALKSTKSARNVTFAKSSDSLMRRPHAGEYQAYCVGGEVATREVWVKQARLLIQQVRGGSGGRGGRDI